MVSRTPSLDRGSINSERETEFILSEDQTNSVTSSFAFTQAARPARQNPRSSPLDSDAAAAANPLAQASLTAQRCTQTQPLLPSKDRGCFIIYLLLPFRDSAISEWLHRLCAREGTTVPKNAKSEATGKAGITERGNKVGCLRREQSRGRSCLTAQSRKVFNCTSVEISEGSLTPALYPQCIPHMYYASVDGSGTGFHWPPRELLPNVPMVAWHWVHMAEGLCLFNSGYLNWLRKPTHTHTSDL